ncbi:MAG: EFR1 family ferrodoxin [Marinifilum sp.]|jgi:ferredoxin|nr:EFR1 family ferrodoxin [Marinifilum sp.]
MKIELKYFTGTGNSFRVLETFDAIFSENINSTNISEIAIDDKRIPESDLLGFCFPVYAFGIPRICYKYLKGIERFNTRQKVFIVVTAGDSNESGFAIKECVKILSRKNCEIIYSAVIQMPNNWTTSPKPPFPPSSEDAKQIIHKGLIQTQEIAKEILNGVIKYHVFNYPKRFSKLKFYWDYWTFKYIGVQNMWRLFNVYDNCNACQLCAKICPTSSIRIIDNKPVWNKTCEQCMRCVNFCPQESIYQTQGGDTKGKNKYHEPNFKPSLKNIK